MQRQQEAAFANIKRCIAASSSLNSLRIIHFCLIEWSRTWSKKKMIALTSRIIRGISRTIVRYDEHSSGIQTWCILSSHYFCNFRFVPRQFLFVTFDVRIQSKSSEVPNSSSSTSTESSYRRRLRKYCHRDRNHQLLSTDVFGAGIISIGFASPDDGIIIVVVVVVAKKELCEFVIIYSYSLHYDALSCCYWWL